MAENKVKFGLKNVHYAVLLTDAEGTATFDTPVAIPGAVSMSMAADGDFAEFYADNGAYYTQSGNAGYSGTLEVALLPDSFREDVLGEVKDMAAGTLTENSAQKSKSFALMFEFSGDAKEVKHVFYNCAASRPDVAGATTTATKDPATETLKLKAGPLSNGNIRSKTTGAEDGTAYAGWYTEVWQPSK